jgi:hypothetical protein
MASGGEPTPSHHGGGRVFTRELSVKVDVLDNTKIKALDIINAVVESAGVGSILACIPKSGNIYEITLADRECVQIVSPGLSVEGTTYRCAEVVQDRGAR